MCSTFRQINDTNLIKSTGRINITSVHQEREKKHTHTYSHNRVHIRIKSVRRFVGSSIETLFIV